MSFELRPSNRLGRAALVAGLGALAVAARQEPPVPSDPITVTGTRLTPAEARERAEMFVRGTGVAEGNEPVARWEDPVCPVVTGIRDPAHAAIVANRIRAVARAAGARVAGDDCQPNIMVSFTEDGPGVMREIVRRSARRLDEVPVVARAELIEGVAPIRWFYTTETRSDHNVSGTTNAPAWTSGNGNGGSVLPQNVPMLFQYRSTTVGTQAARVLRTATVVVDISRMDRMPLDAVASYAALVALAEIRRDDFAPPGSILGLFRPDPGGRELTGWDMAFLRALYSLPLDRHARRHRGMLIRELIEAASGAGGGP